MCVFTGLQITAVQRQCLVKNRFCPDKSLDDRTICLVVFAGEEYYYYRCLSGQKWDMSEQNWFDRTI